MPIRDSYGYAPKLVFPLGEVYIYLFHSPIRRLVDSLFRVATWAYISRLSGHDGAYISYHELHRALISPGDPLPLLTAGGFF